MAARRFALAAALLSGALALRKRKLSRGDCYSPYDGQPLVQLTSTSQGDRDEMLSKIVSLECHDLSEDAGAEIMAICSHSATSILERQYSGRFEVLAGDAAAFYRKSSGVASKFADRPGVASDTFYTQWRDMDSRMARVEAVVSDSEGIATLAQIGTTIENRSIMAVHIKGEGWKPGSPRVVANFQQHAREWIAGMTGVYAVEMAVKKTRADPSWLSGAELVLVPLANPDGIVWSETKFRMWRKNRRVVEGNACMGVDLNRNYPPGWGGKDGTSTNPCTDIYFGTGPFSEPEADAIRNVLDQAPTMLHLDVHAYSQLIIAPYGFTRSLHPRRAELDVPGMAMAEAIKNTHGKVYGYGGSEMLYPAAGVARDYLSSKDGFGWTIELRPDRYGSGGGFAPPPSEILPTAEEFQQALYAAVGWAKNPVKPTPPAPTPEPCSNWCNLFGCGWGSCKTECHKCI